MTTTVAGSVPGVAGGGSWESLKSVTLSKLTLSYVTEKLGFLTMAPVQAKTIPLLLSHYDVVVEAITGSGKTLAYLLPMMEFLLSPRFQAIARETRSAVSTVIILPSRELAQQIHAQVQEMLRYMAAAGRSHADGNPTSTSICDRTTGVVALSSVCLIGGRAIEVDVDIISKKGAHVMVGTPGRMYELVVASKYATLFNFAHLDLVVLDEADKLLEQGFQAKMDALLKRLPKQRRTGLFSATQTKELAELARAGMRNPVSVTVRVHGLGSAPSSAAQASKPQVPQQLTNYYAICKASEKLDRLREFLLQHKNEKVIVYTMTCAGVEWLYEALAKVLEVGALTFHALHGQMPLPQRQKVHSLVTRAKACVLICTDVAARGLDIPEVGLVVQFDPPVAPQTFIHRIGRTGRMGRLGTSLVLLLPQEAEYVHFMKLQNVALAPLDEARDDIEVAEENAKEVDAKRTLASSARHLRTKPKGQLPRKQRRLEAQEAKRARDEADALNRRRKVEGDMCESPSVMALRRAARTMPDLLPLASKAFVSLIRAYKEHECRYIFALNRLDLTDLTHSFALFKIPNCGEIRHIGHLIIPLQDEFSDILERLADEKRRRRQEVEAQAALKGPEDDAEGDDGPPQKKHKTDRGENLAKLKEAKLSKGERSRLWKQEEIREIMRDAYFVKKEKRGYINRRVVDEKLGIDALENAVMSTRDRKENRKRRMK